VIENPELRSDSASRYIAEVEARVEARREARGIAKAVLLVLAERDIEVPDEAMRGHHLLHRHRSARTLAATGLTATTLEEILA
jgi:hypothetical protein